MRHFVDAVLEASSEVLGQRGRRHFEAFKNLFYRLPLLFNDDRIVISET